MYPLFKHLPLLLTLLVPLALLAWLGSREFSRLADHSKTLLQDEAHRFLKAEEFKVREEIQTQAYTWLENIRDSLAQRDMTSIEASRGLIAKEPFIQQVFVAREDFSLIEPRPPQAKSPSAPLSRFPADQDSASKELLRADVLFNMDDVEGAIRCLKSYTDRPPSQNTKGRMWAEFHLAGLFAKQKKNADAELRYLVAGDRAADAYAREPSEDPAVVMLLEQFRLAELKQEPQERHENLLDVLERICTGRYEYLEFVADDVIDWTVEAIVEQLGDEPAVAEALDLDRVRHSGRLFARDYAALAPRELSIARTRNLLKPYQGVIFHVLSTGRGSSLLAMRSATDDESMRYQAVGQEGAERIGLQLDLPALVTNVLSGTPKSPPGNLKLAIHDPTGVPLLVDSSPIPSTEEASLELAPVVSALAGLSFVAVPAKDPAEMQHPERNQAILGLILVVVALVGAFMLIRSVKRETELAQMKVKLLSRVTHELKTPLAVIKMYGETLVLGRTTDSHQIGKFAGVISTEADRLTNMVERILDFSKMEAGTFQYDKEPTDVGKVVEAVTDEYLPHVEAQGVSMNGDIDLGLVADVDPRALASSVVNLLENAIKYTPANVDERSLDVHLHKSNGNAVLEVKDRGIGIPAGERDKIFSDFYRASNAGEVRGAGLGLSMVDHFAKAHDGWLEALPRTDGGTILRLTLPLASHLETGKTQNP